MKRFLPAILTILTLPGLLPVFAQRVYFGTSGSGIYTAEFNATTGTLTTPETAVEIGRPGFLAIHPDQKHLYSIGYGQALGRSGGIVAYRIHPDGTLTQINARSTDGKGACHVSLDRTGSMLMTAYYGSGSIASFQIMEDGSLSEAKSYIIHEGSGAHPKRQNKPYAHSVFPNPANTYAYAADLGADKIFIYKMDPSNGTLTPVGDAAVPGGAMGPRHMKWNADGSLLYILNELDLSVSLFSAEADGQLKFVKTESVLPEGADKEKMTCAEIRIHPNGRFIYTSNRDLTEQGRDSISVFSRHEDGFKRIETVPAQVWIPRNFNLDPTGTWLLVGGQKSSNLAIFKMNPETGHLTFTGQKIAFKDGPICIEFLNQD